jgi:hypothetical protein
VTFSCNIRSILCCGTMFSCRFRFAPFTVPVFISPFQGCFSKGGSLTKR